jgi:serine protease AprX
MTTRILRGLALTLAAFTFATGAAEADSSNKLDSLVKERARQLSGRSRVIVQFQSAPDPRVITRRGGTAGRQIASLGAQVAEVSNVEILAIATDPRVVRIYLDRPAFPTLERTGAAIGAMLAREDLGLSGHGVGVAVIDSGVAAEHNDLSLSRGTSPHRSSRVAHFKDFTQAESSALWLSERPTDDYGHGTHVAGIIAGSGAGSAGAYRGVAPAADLVSLRVLDDEGHGQTSDVIAALEWVLDEGSQYGIDVVNLSLGHPVMEPAELDPLVQAVEDVWNAGIVVVCSAGNRGANGNFTINSPGNSPLVLTVGSLTDWHTPSTADDKVSSYSSRGPSAVDHYLKPDFVAPGNRVVSTTSVSSALAKAFPQSVVVGGAAYLELSGTSMAAAEVSGVVARMLQQDPTLNPATVKSRLVDTAREVGGALPTDAGAGALDMHAALAAGGYSTSAYSPTVVRSDVEGVLELYDTTTGGPTAWSDMSLWSDAGLWTDAVLWGDAALWSDAGLWSDGAPASD